MSRILLLGKDGQLGQELQNDLLHLGEFIAVGRDTVDLAAPEQIRHAIRDFEPHVIVNAAAYTAVDKAESEPERANAINGIAPTVMAEEAQRLKATLIHISTDYVFDGAKNTPYLETDVPNPVGIYGQTKLHGEQGVQEACDRHFILRTAWVYGVGGRGNFVKTMLRFGAERQELRVVMDQVGTPTWTGDLSQAIAQLTTKVLADAIAADSLSGVYHYTNSGAISWYDFAEAIFDEAAAIGFPLAVERVIPITTAEYPTAAARPAYSVLSTRKIQSVLGEPPPYWRKGLRQMLKSLYAKTLQPVL